jgi:4-amino-4-deoxy-L-arabinose transferase-like glycosyltransferase
MAVDILKKGVHPVFCYGSEYAGTLEPHYLALVFGLLSPSATAFRLGVGFLFLLVVSTVAWTARLAYGDRAGLFAGLYLALGPAFLLYKGLTSDGAYTSLLLLFSLAIGLLLRIEDRFSRDLSATPELGFLGIVVGLAWWVHPLAICLGPLAVVSSLLGKTRRWLSPRSLLLLSAGFAGGAFPWLWHNARHGWASLHASEMAPAGANKAASGLVDLFWQGLPRLLGARPVWRRVPTFPGASWVALALLGVLVGFAVYGLRRTPSATGNPVAPTPLARHASLLYLTLIAFLPLLCLSVARTNFREPRYLLPLYLAVAPLTGALLDALWPRRALFALLTAVLLALGPGSEWRAPLFRNLEMGHFESDPERLITVLRARGVNDLYASYWIAYRLDFLSAGRLAASPFGGGDSGLVRDAGLRQQVDGAAAPAFLLCCEDLNRFAAFLAHDSIPHRRETVEGFSLFTGIPPTALARLRGCYCIPEVPSPGSIVWRSIEGPHELSAGGLGRYRVVLENRGKQPLSSNVHLSYHWRRLDGSAALFDGARTQLPPPDIEWWVHRWRKLDLDVSVLAGVPPGEYILVFDLVDENVSWFESYGVPTASYRVIIHPASPVSR